MAVRATLTASTVISTENSYARKARTAPQRTLQQQSKIEYSGIDDDRATILRRELGTRVAWPLYALTRTNDAAVIDFGKVTRNSLDEM